MLVIVEINITAVRWGFLKKGYTLKFKIMKLKLCYSKYYAVILGCAFSSQTIFSSVFITWLEMKI